MFKPERDTCKVKCLQEKNLKNNKINLLFHSQFHVNQITGIKFLPHSRSRQPKNPYGMLL